MRGSKAKRIRSHAAEITPYSHMERRYEVMPGTSGKTRQLAPCFRRTVNMLKIKHRHSKMLDIPA